MTTAHTRAGGRSLEAPPAAAFVAGLSTSLLINAGVAAVAALLAAATLRGPARSAAQHGPAARERQEEPAGGRPLPAYEAAR